MNARNIVSFSVMAFALSTFSFSTQAANLISNGDFTNYTGGYNGAPSQLGNSGADGYTNLASWEEGDGSSQGSTYGFLFAPGANSTTGSQSQRWGSTTFNLWGPGQGGGFVNNGLTYSPSGGNFVALDGDSTLRGNGISQSITGLVIGQNYELGFHWAAAQQKTFNGATTEKVQVDFGGSSQTTATFNLPEHGFSGWMHQTFNFTADSTTQTLRFLAVGTPNGQPPFVLLDGVTLDDGALSVPEPESYALLGIGLLAMMLAAGRRNPHA